MSSSFNERLIIPNPFYNTFLFIGQFNGLFLPELELFIDIKV